jgi:HAE1 family hydrophobic/amphiphilic exporter-1
MKGLSQRSYSFCNERNLGAIISITLVMSAVFIPVSFKRTSRGLYQQFAVTLAIAILISAVNALTLSPALCVIVETAYRL